jgi:hypothetical protein
MSFFLFTTVKMSFAIVKMSFAIVERRLITPWYFDDALVL